MEKDDEIKGTGNSLDFGARIYDSRIGRWLAVDPLFKSTPGITPYRFGFNNPIIFNDNNGQFEIGIHARITSEVLSKYKLPKSHFNFTWGSTMGYSNVPASSIVSSTVHGSMDADYFGFSFDVIHFDNNFTLDDINNSWRNLNKKISTLSIKENAWQLGKALHSVQDFYAHSNYVETYIEYYKEKNRSIEGLTPENIPTFDEAMDSDFKDYKGTQKLHTGSFNAWRWMFGVDKLLSKNEHHDDMAKDHESEGPGAVKPNGSKFTLHQFARGAAKRHSEKIVDKKAKEEGIEEK